MNIVLLTNDNFFSFTAARAFLEQRRDQLKLIVFSAALVGRRGALASVWWSLKNTGLRHTCFKLAVYGFSRLMRVICCLLPFISNGYSSQLWAKRNGIDTVTASDINSPDIVEKIRSTRPDLVVSISMNQIVKKQILELPTRGCINVHCAALPRYAGMSPYVWALANNETCSAATIHYMEEGLDEGDIIAQEMVPVVKGDSAFALFHRCCLKARDLLVKVVDDIEAGRASGRPQDLSAKTYFSWPSKQCIRALRGNGYRLAKLSDFARAVFKQNPRGR